jgi:hypothetical protein
MKKECHRCLKEIDLNKDLYVSLGTHEGKRKVDMVYFHFNCWTLHFEEKAREKAQAVVNGMQERMMPIAKQLTEKLKSVIGQNQ